MKLVRAGLSSRALGNAPELALERSEADRLAPGGSGKGDLGFVASAASPAPDAPERGYFLQM